MNVKVKICGLTTEDAVRAAVVNGADFLGFVFFEKSPRNIAVHDAAMLANFALNINPDIEIVAVTVNPSDDALAELKEFLAPDYIQLHGKEDVARVKEVQAMGFKVIKALGVETAQDLELAQDFYELAEYMLFDAKAPKGEQNAGGFGISFDWAILTGNIPHKPWFLSGGLNPENVKTAINATGVQLVDVSSGIESALGIKDIHKIAQFIKAAKSCA